MKRLKNKLLSMQPDTATYREMYEGIMTVVDPSHPTIEPWSEYSPTYYHDCIGFQIAHTHKLAQDKPSITVCIPCERLGITVTNDAVADYCLRRFRSYVDELNDALDNRRRPDRENGRYYLCTPTGEVLTRNSAYFAIRPQKDYENGTGSTVYLITDGISRPPVPCLCILLQVQLPYKKLRRTVQMLCRDLPDAATRFIADFDTAGMEQAVALVDRQMRIRRALKSSPYCAFIANGSILPRQKGTDLPLSGAVPFRSTPQDEIELCGVRGMGIRRGTTVITGGGYSGKSTLLDAISAGIYDHVAGDGRELCLTDESAVTISAEDGRCVKNLNISPFIKWLPNGNTEDFTTDHASGSTSQAANIMEAVDGGAKLLLIDEDRSATNFMIRDCMMKELIEKEPITPFTDRACELFRTHGVSTILVIGGSGEYLSIADRIYLMEDYRIRDVTEHAKSICRAHGTEPSLPPDTDWGQHRILTAQCFSSYPKGCGSERLEVSDMGFIFIGDERIDTRGLHNLVSTRQLYALGFLLRHIEIRCQGNGLDLLREIDTLYQLIEDEGLDAVYSNYFTTCERFLDLPRKQELLALINRMRKTVYRKNPKVQA